MNLKSMPKHKRPREMLTEKGVKNLSDSELIAIILRTGSTGKNVMHIAEHIVNTMHVADLPQKNIADFTRIKGVGIAHAASLIATGELARRIYSESSRISVTKPEQIVQLLNTISDKKQEHFVCIYLNSRYHIILKKTISIGTVDASLAHPREILLPAIKYSASYIVLAHNHPSGDVEPSQADILLTARVLEACSIIGIELIDHIIVSGDAWTSLKKRGAL